MFGIEVRKPISPRIGQVLFNERFELLFLSHGAKLNATNKGGGRAELLAPTKPGN